MNERQIINGTFAEVWLDGTYVGECYKVQAKMSYTREKIPMAGTLKPGYKLTEITGTGSLGLWKVSSRMGTMVGDRIKAGDDPRFTIIAKVDDPTAKGQERVSLTGVAFDDLTIMDLERATLGKVEVPFTFHDYEYLDRIGD